MRNIKNINILKRKKLKKHRRLIEKEVKERTISYILTAFSLVAGLAWNEAIKTFIEYLFPMNKNSIFAKFIYAFLITFVVVFITIYFNNLLKEDKKEDKNEEDI